MKRLLMGISLMICFIHTALAVAADPVRVKCGNYTMNVPSENVNCYQTDTNIPLPDNATPEELANAQIANTAIRFSDYTFLSGKIPPEVTFYRTEDFVNTSFDLVDISLIVSDMVNETGSDYELPEEDDYFEPDNELSVEEEEDNFEPEDESPEDDDFESNEGLIDFSEHEVPFLPYQAEKRLATALSQKIDFENGSGIRTIAVFQDPIQSASGASNLYYSFQGISEDGNVYVSAVFPLRSMSLNGKSPASVDWDNVTGYDFQPSLAELDYYVASIVIE